ncbi:MAG: glycosyltransferase family 4 protein [Blastocatellia bacterium]|nr:glycosyltransferase family 4 protein [Blastocatellia bacterium]
MKITVVMPTLACGGAERVGAAMANYWAERGDEVTFVTFDPPQASPFYELSPRLRHVKLGLFSVSNNIAAGFKNNLRRWSALRSFFRTTKSDVIISIIGRSNVRVLLATIGFPIPVIVYEQTDPSRDSLSPFWRTLRWIMYRRAQSIVVLTQQFAQSFSPSLQKRLSVIPNPVVMVDTVENKHRPATEAFRLIAVGRLEQEKGFDILLRALAKLSEPLPKWTLTILGEGSQRQYLESLCRQLHLENRISFPGAVKNVAEFLKQSDLFILSSKVEGFPLALCEAMTFGVPVVATDCAASIREIVRDEIDGVIVPPESEEALGKAIAELISKPEKCTKMALSASTIIHKLSLPTIMSKWDKLLQLALG